MRFHVTMAPPILAAVCGGVASAAPPSSREQAEGTTVLARLLENRARSLESLYRYAMAGQFPLNEDHPEESLPIFLDRHGTPCAVAFLMLQSGQESAVHNTARTSNHILIADVAQGPVMSWILGSDLTREECALIQPSYNFRKKGYFPRPRPRLVLRTNVSFAKVKIRTLRPISEEYLPGPWPLSCRCLW